MAARKTIFNDKQRILRLYSSLISHRELSIEEIEDMFFVGRKTVQRDIAEIRTFLHDLQIGEPVKSEIIFDRNSKKYRLTEMDNLFAVFDKINQLDEGI
ncbi:HTH domain-containing protein [Leuconostoc falkenbergense]|uniref:HTH domain-containing protein n=1 Tax=Leuconostoc falkenbergense TaxID=2766470 RepID=A0A9X3EBJ0_9LACO|nr:HTH domain-containing protein [Leuconostoc falkenbergense]MCX7578058.1 HTH domain-containing protein [Leuconostoc falkenbergense]